MRNTFLRRALARLANDDRGTALIEFAFVLPFLVLLYIGGYQLMDGISASRKVVNTVRTLADLTTKNTTITPAQADEILNASRQIMAPYSPNDAVLKISQVQISASGQATISWSRALNGTAYTNGESLTVPTALATPNTYYIYSEIDFTYRPKIASLLIGIIPLRQVIFMSPRNSQFVTYQP